MEEVNENQWKSMLDELENTNTAAVYVKNQEIFGYIHWMNKLTRKKQGYVKKGVNEKEVMTLLANYSFNGRPMIYKRVEVKSIYTSTRYTEAAVSKSRNDGKRGNSI